MREAMNLKRGHVGKPLFVRPVCGTWQFRITKRAKLQCISMNGGQDGHDEHERLDVSKV